MLWRGAFLVRAGLITPLLFLLTFAEGCTQNYAIQIFPGQVPENVFPQIAKRDQLLVSGNEAGLELRVYYTAGENKLAEEALAEVRKPPRFLSEITGITPKGLAGFYLYPLPTSGVAPFFTAKGAGTYTGVFLYRENVPLAAISSNKEWLNGAYVHELTHRVLDSSKLRLDDRWLGDGIPEYLAREFTLLNDPELSRGDYRLTPSLIALSKARLQAWDMSDFNAFQEKLPSDPDYAQMLAERMVWRYAAAEELVKRWMTAAQANGIQVPLRDLLGRIKARGGSIDWKATRELAQAQTGKTLEELARVAPEELVEEEAKAWEDRASLNIGARVHALSVISVLGLPATHSAGDLLPSFSIPPEFSEVKQGWVWQVFQQGGLAVAKANDPALAKRVAELARESWGDAGYGFIPPELWRALAATDRPMATEQLVVTLTRSDTPLSVKARANEALKALTRQDVGWSAAEKPAQRDQAAGRWRTVLLP